MTTPIIRATLPCMSKATPQDLRRMTLSRVTLAGLEQSGMTGRREDNVRILTEEIGILEGFIAKYPGKADTLSAVIERYRALLRPLVS